MHKGWQDDEGEGWSMSDLDALVILCALFVFLVLLGFWFGSSPMTSADYFRRAVGL